MTDAINDEDGRQIEGYRPPSRPEQINKIIRHCTEGEGDHIELIFRLNFMGIDRKVIIALVVGLYATDGQAASAIKWRERTEAALDAIKAFSRMDDRDQVLLAPWVEQY